jgi:hypothetical protein
LRSTLIMCIRQLAVDANRRCSVHGFVLAMIASKAARGAGEPCPAQVLVAHADTVRYPAGKA